MLGSNSEYRRKRNRLKRRTPSRTKIPRLGDRLREMDARYLDTLWGGQNPIDQSQLIMGYLDRLGRTPIVLNRSVYNEHMLTAGASGSGKTTWIIGQQKQLIEQNRLLISQGLPASSIFIVDLRPDDVMFHVGRHAATHDDGETPPLPFRWLDISRSDTPTFLFNVFEQEFFRHLTPFEKAAFLVQAFGMYYGSGYGKEWYGLNLHECCIRVFSRDDPYSFRDLVDYALRTPKEMAEHLNLSAKDFDSMRHLTLQLGYLARRPELTPSVAHPFGIPKVAVEQRLDLGKAIQPGNEQVIYLRLNSTMDTRTARLTASLVIASLNFAKQYYKDTIRAQMFVDESHMLADEHNMPDWLAKCRGSGVSLTLGTQTLAQWPPETRELIVNSTNFKTFFASPDMTQFDIVQHLSGHKFQTRVSTSESMTFRVPVLGSGFELDSITEGMTESCVEVPGITNNELLRNNFRRSAGIFAMTSEVEDSYYQPDDGRAREFYRSYPLPLEVHQQLSNRPVPNSVGTYVPSNYPSLMADPVLIEDQQGKAMIGQENKQRKRKKAKPKRRSSQNNEFADVLNEYKQENTDK